jgi:hypothetical protein
MDKEIKSRFIKQSTQQLLNLKINEIETIDEIELVDNYKTIISSPEGEALKEIRKIISDLKSIDDNQLYYKPANLHLTILGGLPASLKDNDIRNAVKKHLPDNLKFNLGYLACNSRGPSVTAFPVNFNLSKLRRNLRQELGVKGTDYTSFINTYEHLAWINFARFNQPPKQAFLDYIIENQRITLPDLHVNDYYHCESNSRILDIENCDLIS